MEEIEERFSEEKMAELLALVEQTVPEHSSVENAANEP